MRSILCKIVLTVFIFSIIGPVGVEASLWKERSMSYHKQQQRQNQFQRWVVAGHSLSPRKVSKPSPLENQIHFHSFNLPFLKSLGKNATLETIFDPPHHPSGKEIFLIQDVHNVVSVQKRIKRLVDYFIDNGIEVIGLEGASGKMKEMERIRQFPSKQVLKQTANHFLEGGALTGAEVSGLLTEKDKVLFWGVEEAPVYWEQVKTFKQTLQSTEQSQRALKALEERLEQDKQNVYPEPLLHLSQQEQAYQNKELSLNEWVNIWTEQVPEVLNHFQAVRQFKILTSLEEPLQSKKLGKIEQTFYKTLQENVSFETVEAIIEKALSYRKGTVPLTDYFAHIKTESKKVGVEIPELLKESWDYRMAREELDLSVLFSQLEEAIDWVWSRYEKGNIQIQAVRQREKEIFLLKKAVLFHLTPKEAKAVRELGYKESYPEPLQNILKEVLRFTELSERRDSIFLKELFQAMEEQGTDRAVLVAGGYHRKGIEKELKKTNTAFVSLLPHMNTDHIDQETDPLAIFRGNLKPLQKQGALSEKRSLSPYLTLGKRDRRSGHQEHTLDNLETMYDSFGGTERTLTFRELFKEIKEFHNRIIYDYEIVGFNIENEEVQVSLLRQGVGVIATFPFVSGWNHFSLLTEIYRALLGDNQTDTSLEAWKWMTTFEILEKKWLNKINSIEELENVIREIRSKFPKESVSVKALALRSLELSSYLLPVVQPYVEPLQATSTVPPSEPHASSNTWGERVVSSVSSWSRALFLLPFLRLPGAKAASALLPKEEQTPTFLETTEEETQSPILDRSPIEEALETGVFKFEEDVYQQKMGRGTRAENKMSPLILVSDESVSVQHLAELARKKRLLVFWRTDDPIAETGGLFPISKSKIDLEEIEFFLFAWRHDIPSQVVLIAPEKTLSNFKSNEVALNSVPISSVPITQKALDSIQEFFKMKDSLEVEVTKETAEMFVTAMESQNWSQLIYIAERMYRKTKNEKYLLVAKNYRWIESNYPNFSIDPKNIMQTIESLQYYLDHGLLLDALRIWNEKVTEEFVFGVQLANEEKS